MAEAAEISFKIEFLRTMVPVMTEPDQEDFRNVCDEFRKGTAVMAHLEILNRLYKKFDKPAGAGRI